MKKITVETTISKDGKQLVAHVQGIKGEGCKDITQALATANKIVEERETSEAFERELDVQQNTYSR